MNKNYITALLLIIIIGMGCKKKDKITVTPVDTSGKVHVPPTPNTQHISVLTQHNDNTRAGLNNQEKVLTTTNVNPTQFGKLFSLSVDDEVFAQPLVVGNLPISSGTHNVVFVATVNNTVYAFDGDNGTQYWKKNFTVTGMRPPNSNDMASSWCSPYRDIDNNIGIIGTPAIDSAAQTIYFVARSTDGNYFYQYLHAVDLLTGADKPGSPVKITGSVIGTGDGALNGLVNFDPLRNNQRQGLTLVNGVVYITFASHCDWNPYHGWILGYNSTTLQQQTIYNVTPNGEEGGIWESGMGMAADGQGNLYVVTGNGTVGKTVPYVGPGNGTGENSASSDPTDPSGRAESAMKLSPSGSTLQVTSFFTPANYVDLNVNDLDYGVMGTFLIPNTSYYLTGCKDGNLYVLNKDNMGGYLSSINQVVQTVPLNASLHCQPSYYQGSTNDYIYVWSENDQLRQLSFNPNTGQIASNQIVSKDVGPGGQTGADIAVSSNGTADGTGIVWAAYQTQTNGDAGGPTLGILRAFDARDVTKELWSSNYNIADFVGDYAKFASPTIADGHVYLATFSNKVMVYGLK